MIDFDDQERKMLRTYFDALDDDGSGSIDVTELEEVSADVSAGGSNQNDDTASLSSRSIFYLSLFRLDVRIGKAPV